MDEPKTRIMAEAFEGLGLAGKLLVIDTNFEHNAYLASRNLPNVSLQHAQSLNLIDVLGADTLVFTVPALQAMEERLSNAPS
jgi:large subunit ribosomal protein L4